MGAIKLSGGSYDEMMKTLQVEVHDDATDRLNEMIRTLDRMAENGPNDADLSAFRRLAHNLKGLGGSFGYPAMSQIAHRLESYVADMTTWSDDTPRKLQLFLDGMGEMLERSVQPSDEELSRIVRALPTHLIQNFSADDMRIANVEILLVTPTRAIAKLLTQQVNACGFRVNAVSDPVDGLTAVLRSRPDMVITSQEMRTMTGLDLVRAVKAIASVAKTPAAILTSKSNDRAAFPGLPEDVMLLRTGDLFADDFAKAIAQFGIG